MMLNNTLDQSGAAKRFYPDMTGNDADRIKNKMKN
jgi:hypothetical protein